MVVAGARTVQLRGFWVEGIIGRASGSLSGPLIPLAYPLGPCPSTIATGSAKVFALVESDGVPCFGGVRMAAQTRRSERVHFDPPTVPASDGFDYPMAGEPYRSWDPATVKASLVTTPSACPASGRRPHRPLQRARLSVGGGAA